MVAFCSQTLLNSCRILTISGWHRKAKPNGPEQDDLLRAWLVENIDMVRELVDLAALVDREL